MADDRVEIQIAELTPLKAAESGTGGGDNGAGLTQKEAEELLVVHGRNEIPEDITPIWKMILSQFSGPMPLMILVACVLAGAVAAWDDFSIILLMLLANACLGFREEYHAQQAIRELAAGLKPKVSVKRDGKSVLLDVGLLVPGDVIFVRGGNKIPADCHYYKGDELSLDNSALTGESRLVKRPLKGCTVTKVSKDDDGIAEFTVETPDGQEQPGLFRDQLLPSSGSSDIKEGDKISLVDCLSGGTLKQGEAYCVVDRTGLNTEIGKASGGASAPGKGVFQRSIEKACALYIVATLFFVVAMLVLSVYEKEHDVKAIILPVLSLVISAVPVALPMVITVTLAIGAQKMSREGAIVTNLGALQEVASMDVLCSDKTGTLTTAEMTVYCDKVWVNPGLGCSAEDVITWAVLASNRDNVDDPIDKAVVEGFDKKYPGNAGEEKLEGYEEEDFIGFNPLVKRTVAIVKTKQGETYTIAKGLLDKVLDTGNDEGIMQWVVEDFGAISTLAREADEALSLDAFKTVGVSIKKGEGPWYFAGILPMRDPPRHDTEETIKNVRASHIHVKMLTGDHINIAKKTAQQIHLGDNIYGHSDLWPVSTARDLLIEEAEGFAKVTPTDKLEVVAIEQKVFKHVVGMTGDGVNDAPALKKANIGIAVLGATDAAQAAADIVLTTPGLSAIYSAVLESRRIFKRIQAYVVYRLSTTVQIVLTLFCLSLAFRVQIPAFYVILVALMADLIALPLSSDIAQPSAGPSKPNVKLMIIMSLFLGIFLAGASLLGYMLMAHYYYGDDDVPLSIPDELKDLYLGSDKCDATITAIGFSGASVTINAHIYCMLEVAVFLQLYFTAPLLMLMSRTPGLWFLSRPGNAVIIGCVLAYGVALILVWVPMKALVFETLPYDLVGYVALFVLVYCSVLDLLKVGVYRAFAEKDAKQAPYSLVSAGSAGTLYSRQRPVSMRKLGGFFSSWD